jgi:hypothetical protein
VHLLEEDVHGALVAAVAADELDQEGGGVDAEARDAERDPKARDLEDLVPDGRVRDVEVGLVVIEAVEIKRLGCLVPGPP